MNGNAGTGGAPSNATIIGTLALLASGAMFAYLAYTGATRNGLVIPAAFGWIAALAIMRPRVDRDRRAALYFAFGILALMIFFIHQTYGYKGQVRDFPLIVGYTGVVLCILDILSVGGGPVASAITRFFGSHLDESELVGRPLRRELIACAAIGGCVLGIWLFGFLAFSPLFVVLWMLAGGKTVKNALYGGMFTLIFIYLLFELAFQYELFRGVVFIWLFDL